MIQKTTKYEKVKQTFKLNTTYKLQYSTVTVWRKARQQELSWYKMDTV